MKQLLFILTLGASIGTIGVISTNPQFVQQGVSLFSAAAEGSDAVSSYAAPGAPGEEQLAKFMSDYPSATQTPPNSAPKFEPIAVAQSPQVGGPVGGPVYASPQAPVASNPFPPIGTSSMQGKPAALPVFEAGHATQPGGMPTVSPYPAQETTGFASTRPQAPGEQTGFASSSGRIPANDVSATFALIDQWSEPPTYPVSPAAPQPVSPQPITPQPVAPTVIIPVQPVPAAQHPNPIPPSMPDPRNSVSVPSHFAGKPEPVHENTTGSFPVAAPIVHPNSVSNDSTPPNPASSNPFPVTVSVPTPPPAVQPPAVQSAPIAPVSNDPAPMDPFAIVLMGSDPKPQPAVPDPVPASIPASAPAPQNVQREEIPPAYAAREDEMNQAAAPAVSAFGFPVAQAVSNDATQNHAIVSDTLPKNDSSVVPASPTEIASAGNFGNVFAPTHDQVSAPVAQKSPIPHPDDSKGREMPPMTIAAIPPRLEQEPQPVSVPGNPEIGSQFLINPSIIAEEIPCHGTEMIARVGTEVILMCDVLPQLRRIALRYLKEELNEKGIPEDQHGQIPQSEKDFYINSFIEHQYPFFLKEQINVSLIYNDFVMSKSKEERDFFEKKMAEEFDEHDIPGMLKEFGVKDQVELKKFLKEELGSSLDRERMLTVRSNIARQWSMAMLTADSECTHDEMMEYYIQNKAEFETKARCRWREMFVLFSKHKTEKDAWKKMVWMGNHVAGGSSFEEMAKVNSEGMTAREGGVWDWTKRGTLASEDLENAIFTTPVGELSPIIKAEKGLHIIQVIEREDDKVTPFIDAQVTIRQKIQMQRRQRQQEEYYEELKRKYPTIVLRERIDFDASRSAAQTPNVNR